MRIPIRAAEIALGAADTLNDGTYQLGLPPLTPGDWLLRATYAGSDDWWPALAEVNLMARGNARVR